jgi:hypothetical protein
VVEIGFACVWWRAVGQPSDMLLWGLVLNVLGIAIDLANLNHLSRHREALRTQLLNLGKVPTRIIS